MWLVIMVRLAVRFGYLGLAGLPATSSATCENSRLHSSATEVIRQMVLPSAVHLFRETAIARSLVFPGIRSSSSISRDAVLFRLEGLFHDQRKENLAGAMAGIALHFIESINR
jgi:hypothetical protein